MSHKIALLVFAHKNFGFARSRIRKFTVELLNISPQL
jgi:hypothetical protein